MDRFLLREVSSENIKSELISIGYDLHYLDEISNKFKYKNIKIYNLSIAQANILKQTALIFGADCAVNKNVITGKIDLSDVILCGSYSQLTKIALKLNSQPFKLAQLSECILKFLSKNEKNTKLVGILNITQDSFSDGGMYFKPDDAKKHLLQLIEQGADIVDIGAESTKLYSIPIEENEQIERLKPILSFIQKEKLNVKISVDTKSSIVADFALNYGVNIINDVSGFDFDNMMPQVISKYKAGVIIQHSRGNSENILHYENVVDDVFRDLKNKVELAQQFGITDIIIDAGIGFGKSREDNLKILSNIKAFFSLNCPVMAGISRKTVLGVNQNDNDLKDTFTLAYSYPLILSGIDYLRVHNVKLHREFLNNLST